MGRCPGRRVLAVVGAVVSIGAAVVAAVGTASGGSAVKPVIGRPVTVPARPLSGKRFIVSFKVVRSDTRAPMLRGTMVGDLSIAGKAVRHAESFKAGTARLSFLVPTTAAGKLLRVKVTIKAGRQSATRVASFRVARGTPLPLLSIGDESIAEGNAGRTLMSFPVTLSTADRQPVTVSYATADGTATAPDDYEATSGTLTFKPGTTTRMITVAVVGDRGLESNETLTVGLSDATNAKISTGSATGTIADDDVRGGHYAGTTSQGLPITFDVTPDVQEVQDLKVGADWTCVEAPVKLFGNTLRPPVDPVPIAPDLSFQYTYAFADSGDSENLTFSGKLSPPGTASGTYRDDMVSNQNVWGIPNLHCSTGDVTWTAS